MTIELVPTGPPPITDWEAFFTFVLTGTGIFTVAWGLVWIGLRFAGGSRVQGLHVPLANRRPR